MKNNKGFSLIEVVVVIAIMGIVTFLSVNMLGSAKRSKMRNFANDVKNSIDVIKSDSLSKKGYYRIVIKRDGDDIIANEMYAESKSSTYTLKDTITIVSNDSSNNYDIVDGSYNLTSNNIIIEFNKSDGSMDIAGWSASSGTEASPTIVSDISSLSMKYADSSKALTISKITGKYYFDN